MWLFTENLKNEVVTHKLSKDFKKNNYAGEKKDQK